MCGIAGIVGLGGDGQRAMAALYRTLQHRGPDDRGYLVMTRNAVEVGRDLPASVAPGSTALIHRRLAILDLTDAGWQPMATADRRYYIVLNGEIYNYLELRDELERLGHTFRSHGDTEVLLTAYAEWGSACLRRLVGMFAFAVLDTLEHRLFIARDPFGIKPLYYARVGDEIIFASELRALVAHPGTNRRIDPQRAYLYLRYGVTDHGDGTLLSDIRQLEAGSYVEISLDDRRVSQPTRYWTLEPREIQDISFDEAARKLRELFIDSVRLHLRSDVPVGTALSGGVDSSAIVATMRLLGGAGLALHAFSYVSDDAALSEERWIDVVAAATKADLHIVQCSGNELREHLSTLVRLQGEPFASTSIFAQYLVFQTAAKHGIKVMLDGQGADEMLAGYRPYLGVRVASLLRAGRWEEALRLGAMASRLPGMTAASVSALAAAAILPPALQAPLRKLVGRDAVPSWFNRRWLRDRDVERQIYGYAPGSHALIGALRLSIESSSLPHLLRYEDRNSMAFSIESRVPFLTPPLVEFVLSLPEEYLISGDGTSKAVFRSAMRGIVPDDILNRRDKVAFVTPESKWLAKNADWVDEVLSSDTASACPIFNLPKVRHEACRLYSGATTSTSALWRCLNLVAWAAEFGSTWE